MLKSDTYMMNFVVDFYAEFVKIKLLYYGFIALLLKLRRYYFNMKKFIPLCLAIIMAIGLVGCANETTSTTPAAPSESSEGAQISVALLIAGNLGDMSFNDSAHRGVLRAEAELGVSIRVIEDNSDPARWETTLLEMADEGHDIIIGANNYSSYIERHADDFPNTTFILFDDEIDWSLGNFANVNCIIYKQNEGSFLGGYLVASLSESGIIGFLGGMDIPIINDFLVGYIEGALHANPDIGIISVYSNAFNDSALGKELAFAMINQGADYIFNVAGGTGIGLIEAASERGTRVLGVDSDQALAFQEAGRYEFAEVITSSVLKNVDFSLFRAIQNYMNGTLVLGGTEFLGIAEGGMGLADNEFFRAHVPADVIGRLEALEQSIINGDIVIGTTLGNNAVDAVALRNSVSPL